MKPSRPHPVNELLAAYVDGELDPAMQARLEQWLNDHPEALADLNAQWTLSRQNDPFWQAVAAPEPGEDRWQQMFDRIEQRLLVVPVVETPATHRRRWHWLGMALVAPAIAASLLIAIGTDTWRPVGSLGVREMAGHAAPLPVMEESDVQILSLHDADALALVVGQHPVARDIELAAIGDVAVRRITPDTADGSMPESQMMPTGAEIPMIFARLPARSP